MRILLTNDDGYGSEGIEALAGRLEKEHSVFVLAPSGNRSGSSSCLNMYKKLELLKKGQNRYALDGSPVDCVLCALKGDVFLKSSDSFFDLVISGINADANFGTDAVYSGTCGAARQACLSGVPGIALSVEHVPGEKGLFKYEAMAEFAAKNLNKLIELCGKAETKENGGRYPFFVSVNALSQDSYEKVCYAGLSSRLYEDIVECEKTSDGRTYLSIVGNGLPIKSLGNEWNDFRKVNEGYVTVSLLKSECSWKTEIEGNTDSFMV